MTALGARSAIGSDAFLVMHAVMVVFISAFLVFGWRRMSEGLEVWRAILSLGLVFTALGLYGFLFDLGFSVSLLPELAYWFLAPALGSVYTGREMEEGSPVLIGGVASLLSGAVALYGVSAGGAVLITGLGGKAVGDFVSLTGAVRRS